LGKVTGIQYLTFSRNRGRVRRPDREEDYGRNIGRTRPRRAGAESAYVDAVATGRGGVVASLRYYRMAPMRSGRWMRAGAVGLPLGLAGCASYEPLELPQHPSLAPALGQLNLELPSGQADSPTKLDAERPLTPDQVGLLAVVNNPELAAERGKVAAAEAEVISARALPNPSLTFAYGILVSGPAMADSITASISQDIQSIITYRPHVAAARSRFRQVRADSLWQEWQVAQKARLLAIGVNADAREIQLREHALDQLTSDL